MARRFSGGIAKNVGDTAKSVGKNVGGFADELKDGIVTQTSKITGTCRPLNLEPRTSNLKPRPCNFTQTTEIAGTSKPLDPESIGAHTLTDHAICSRQIMPYVQPCRSVNRSCHMFQTLRQG